MCSDNHNKNWMHTLFPRKQKKIKNEKSSWLLSRLTHLTIKDTKAVSQARNWMANCSFVWVRKQNNSGCNVWVRTCASEKRLYLLNQCQQKLHSQDRYWEPGSGLSKVCVTHYALVHCCSIDLDYTTQTLLEHHNPWLAFKIGTV